MQICSVPVCKTLVHFFAQAPGELPITAGTGVPQPVTQQFAAQQHPTAAAWQSQKESASVSWADRALQPATGVTKSESKEPQPRSVVINVQADSTMDVRRVADNQAPGALGNPVYQPVAIAAPVPPIGQPAAAAAAPAAAGPYGSPNSSIIRRHAHAHTRTRSGLEMKDSYLDDELDEDW